MVPKERKESQDKILVNVVINFLPDLYVLVPNILQISYKNSYSILYFWCWYL